MYRLNMADTYVKTHQHPNSHAKLSQLFLILALMQSEKSGGIRAV